MSIVQGGGLGGFVTTTVADDRALSEEDAETLRTKIAESGVLELQPQHERGRGRAPAQPDRPSYEISADDGTRSNRVVISEEDVPPAVRDLISWVESVPGREERVSRPGRG